MLIKNNFLSQFAILKPSSLAHFPLCSYCICSHFRLSINYWISYLPFYYISVYKLVDIWKVTLWSVLSIKKCINWKVRETKKKKKHQINPDSKCTDFLSRIHRKPSATAWAAGDLDKTESENSKWPLRPDGLSDIRGLGSLLVWK